MKKTLSLILCTIFICLSFTGCGGPNAKMTEENITETVNTAFTALKEFDTEALEKYVDSPTLSVIMSYAKEHEQFVSLGKAIFENLQIEIKEIDIQASTVVVSVKNKDLFIIASDFAQELKSNYNTFALLTKLNDNDFLDAKLSVLTDKINEAEMAEQSIDITLNITQGKKNLILSFDNNAEDAVSGGALNAIKAIFS